MRQKGRITILVLLTVLMSNSLLAQFDWDEVEVPADAGVGKVWELQEDISDDFNYIFQEVDTKTNFGDNKWYNFYHNSWDGPGRTYWKYNHTSVNGSELVLRTSNSQETSKGQNTRNAACITSNGRVKYPVFVEGQLSVANIAIASDIWLLSPDDKQEIDIIECYGGAPWFEQFIHLSHHSFIRNPFHDYQPKDMNSWWSDNDLTGGSWGKYCYNEGNERQFIRVGINWIAPSHIQYFVDGEMVRVLYEDAVATKINGTWQYTYYDAIHPANTKNEWGTNIGGMPTSTNGYSDVTLYETSASYSFDTHQAASTASNGINVVDPGNYQGNEDSFTKELEIIINVEVQDWHLGDTWVIDDEDLTDPDLSDMLVDWIRVYKPIDAASHVTSVSITPASISTGIAQERILKADVLPSNVSEADIVWSSDDESIAKVDQRGVVTGVAAGSTVIKATSSKGVSGNIVGSCTVSVQTETVAVLVESISLATSALKAAPGEEIKLSATLLPGDVSNKSLTWKSSDSEIASVVATTGVVSCIKDGNVTITASANDGSGVEKSIDLIVETFIPPGIEVINPMQYKSQAYKVGDEIKISCKYNSGTGYSIDSEGIKFWLRRIKSDWSAVVTDYEYFDVSAVGTQSGTATATISLDGVPPTSEIGTDFYFLFVSANDGGFEAPGISPIIIVTDDIDIESITVTPASISTGIGQTRGLSATYMPQLVTDPSIVWSSDDESVATVDQKGLIVGKGEGSTTIRATSSKGVEGTCMVTVEKQDVSVLVSKIAITAPRQSAEPGESINLSASVLPNDASDKSVSWSSSDPSIASVDQSSGLVECHKLGKVTITALANDASGVKSTIDIFVEEITEGYIDVSDPSLYKTTIYVVNGEMTVTCDYHAGTGNKIDGEGVKFWLRRMTSDWSKVVTDYIAFDVNTAGTERGKATAKIALQDIVPSDEIGTDFYFLWITANDAKIRYSGIHPILISNDAVAVESITLSQETASIEIGETVELLGTFTPASASNKNIIWESSDDKIASVDAGIVSGLSVGKVTITATTEDGNKSASCEITVSEKTSSLDGNNEIAMPFLAYPNPTATTLKIEGIKGLGNAVIYNISGQVVLKAQINNNQAIDLTSIESGIYFVKVKDTQDEAILRVSVVK